MSQTTLNKLNKWIKIISSGGFIRKFKKFKTLNSANMANMHLFETSTYDFAIACPDALPKGNLVEWAHSANLHFKIFTFIPLKSENGGFVSVGSWRVSID